MRYVQRTDAPLGAQRSHRCPAGARVVEHRIHHRLFRRPRMKVVQLQPFGQLADQPVQRTGLARRGQRGFHQVQMGVGHLAAQFFEPCGGRQHHVGKTARGVVQEQVVADHQVGALQSGRHLRRIGERRQHVRAQQQQAANAPIEQPRCDRRHLVGQRGTGLPALGRRDTAQAAAVRRAAVARSESGAGDADVAGEPGQARDRAPGLPAVGALVHRTATEHDHRRPGAGIAAGQRHDAFGGNASDAGSPLRRIGLQMGSERLEAQRVPRDERCIVKPFGADYMHQCQRQRGVGAGPDDHHLVGLGGGLGTAHVDRDDVRAAVLGGEQMARGVGLAGQVGCPQHDHLRMLAHVLLGVGLQHAGQPEPERAQPPADHRRAQELAAVDIGEARHQLRADAGAVVGGECAVAGPDRCSLRRRPCDRRYDALECFVPGGRPEAIAAPVADQRMQQPCRVADDLARCLPADAQEAAAVGVRFVTSYAQQLAVTHLGQHAAQGRMTVHRAHRADDLRRGLGHRVLRLDDNGICARSCVLAPMAPVAALSLRCYCADPAIRRSTLPPRPRCRARWPSPATPPRPPRRAPPTPGG